MAIEKLSGEISDALEFSTDKPVEDSTRMVSTEWPAIPAERVKLQNGVEMSSEEYLRKNNSNNRAGS